MDDTNQVSLADHIQLAADIVAAYVANNSIPVASLSELIISVHNAVAGLGQTSGQPPADAVEKATPAQIRKSITPDALISFEDGKSYKTLRRHLTLRGLTPEAYRAKHGLPADYPMTSATYSQQRSDLARTLGLGQQRRKPATKASGAAETASTDAGVDDEGRNPASGRTPKKVGRPRKTVAAAEAAD